MTQNINFQSILDMGLRTRWLGREASRYPLAKRASATLRDAANYIKKLQKSERDVREWRLAIHLLIDAAEDRGPMLFAKMGINRALNRNVERVFKPDRKNMH